MIEKRARGTVKAYNEDEGWGVLVSPEVPGEVWVSFMHLESFINRDPDITVKLDPGATVQFDYITMSEPGGQDGFSYRATWVEQLP
jgi:CspA family cold shock protein